MFCSDLSWAAKFSAASANAVWAQRLSDQGADCVVSVVRGDDWASKFVPSQLNPRQQVRTPVRRSLCSTSDRWEGDHHQTHDPSDLRISRKIPPYGPCLEIYPLARRPRSRRRAPRSSASHNQNHTSSLIGRVRRRIQRRHRLLYCPCKEALRRMASRCKPAVEPDTSPG